MIRRKVSIPSIMRSRQDSSTFCRVPSPSFVSFTHFAHLDGCSILVASMLKGWCESKKHVQWYVFSSRSDISYKNIRHYIIFNHVDICAFLNRIPGSSGNIFWGASQAQQEKGTVIKVLHEGLLDKWTSKCLAERSVCWRGFSYHGIESYPPWN